MIHDELCKRLYFGECSGRVRTVVLDMGKFVKSCIGTLTLRAGRPILVKSIPGGGQGRVSSSPLVFSGYSSVSRNGS